MRKMLEFVYNHKEMKVEEVLKKLFEAVLEGDFEGVKSNVQVALDAKLDPKVILSDGMIAALHEVLFA